MYNIDTLAKLTGTSRRTIRYYIQRGLLSPPEGHNRGSFYTEKHIGQIRKIQILSNRGVPLAYMSSLMEDGDSQTETEQDFPPRLEDLPEKYEAGPSHWLRIKLCEGVELHYQPDFINEKTIRKIKDFTKKAVNENKDGK